jgi:hypothetical protein
VTIPPDFYSRFKWKTSFMAAGTGFVMGAFTCIIVPPWFHLLIRLLPVPLGGLVAVLLNLWIIHGYFKGKMRGVFEYVLATS